MLELKLSHAHHPIDTIFSREVDAAVGKLSSWSNACEEVHGAANYDGFIDIHAGVL